MENKIDNSAFEKAMAALKKDNSSINIDRLVGELIDSLKLIMPVHIEGKHVDRKMAFAAVQNKENKVFYVGFTNRMALKRFNPGFKGSTVNFEFEQFSNLLINAKGFSGIVVNPGTDDFVIGRKMITDLNARIKAAENGMTIDRASDMEKAVFGDAKDIDEDIIYRLKAFMGLKEEINAAYIRNMEVGEKKAYLLVVDHEECNVNKLFEEIFKQLEDDMKKKPFYIISKSADAAKKAISEVEPFYTK